MKRALYFSVVLLGLVSLFGIYNNGNRPEPSSHAEMDRNNDDKGPTFADPSVNTPPVTAMATTEPAYPEGVVPLNAEAKAELGPVTQARLERVASLESGFNAEPVGAESKELEYAFSALLDQQHVLPEKMECRQFRCRAIIHEEDLDPMVTAGVEVQLSQGTYYAYFDPNLM